MKAFGFLMYILLITYGVYLSCRFIYHKPRWIDAFIPYILFTVIAIIYWVV